mmetsp:Transcript_137690/g.294268  ORF Transcript_137690/g.294268 Transcript_137690/m.294268 type:complete len:223 (-) Transcript_137690:186-854(-)
MIALLEASPRGSTLRISCKMSASILAFSAYRLTSLITLIATSRPWSRSSVASSTRPNVPSPSNLLTTYLEFNLMPFFQEKCTISSLSESPSFLPFPPPLSSDEPQESELLLYSELSSRERLRRPRSPDAERSRRRSQVLPPLRAQLPPRRLRLRSCRRSLPWWPLSRPEPRGDGQPPPRPPPWRLSRLSLRVSSRRPPVFTRFPFQSRSSRPLWPSRPSRPL